MFRKISLVVLLAAGLQATPVAVSSVVRELQAELGVPVPGVMLLAEKEPKLYAQLTDLLPLLADESVERALFLKTFRPLLSQHQLDSAYRGGVEKLPRLLEPLVAADTYLKVTQFCTSVQSSKNSAVSGKQSLWMRLKRFGLPIATILAIVPIATILAIVATLFVWRRMVTTTSGAVTSRERKDESANHALAISPKTEEACRKIFKAVLAKYEATEPRVLFSILNWRAKDTNRTVVLDANGSLFFRSDNGSYYAFSRFLGYMDDEVVSVDAKIEVPVTTLSAAGYAGFRGDMRRQQKHFLAYNGPIDTAFENAIGYAQTIGRRCEMKDTMAIKRLNQRYSFFGVFDGHVGRQVADKVARELANKVAAHFSTRDLTDAELNQVWGEMDKACEEGARGSGATATVALLDRQNEELCMVNLGDARMVLVNGDTGDVIEKTADHKPTNENEKKRIEEQRGSVSAGLVNGYLAVSRAFGDFSQKPLKNYHDPSQGCWYQVGIVPTITRCNLPAKGYLILACDGLWDVITSEDAATFTARAGAEGMSPQEIATELLSAAYTGNITESNRTRGLKITPTVQTSLGFQQMSSDNISVQVIDIAKLRETGALTC